MNENVKFWQTKRFWLGNQIRFYVFSPHFSYLTTVKLPKSYQVAYKTQIKVSAIIKASG